MELFFISLLVVIRSGVGTSTDKRLKKKRSEQGLEFEKRTFKDGTISSFVDRWSNVAIENLYLTEKQTQELSECLEKNNEHIFNLSLKNTIADGGIETLKPAFKQLKNLQTLDMSCTNIGAEECEHLVEILLDGTTNVQHLILRGNHLEDEGTNILTTALQRLPSLKTLNLSQCSLGDDAIESLFDYLSENSTLTELRVSVNRIRAEGWRYMASLLGENDKLEVLRVDGNQMGDEGVGLLRNGIVKNKTLCTLDVSNNELTDDGWEVLYEATVKCTSLINLYFEGNSFSQDKLQLLEKLIKMKN